MQRIKHTHTHTHREERHKTIIQVPDEKNRKCTVLPK